MAFGSKDGTGLNRDVIAWFVLTPSVTSSGTVSATIYKQGCVKPTNGYSLSYAAFGLNKTGAGAMGFTETNKSASVPSGYPSASSIQFTGTATTGSIFVTGPGKTSDDGFTGCRKPGSGEERDAGTEPLVIRERKSNPPAQDYNMFNSSLRVC